ncbi:MAG TPA: hypothetical protein VGX78_20195, partial [Pirellulales bacterium]|nr:hypothetical protein [Pirellulales bacterium]
LHRATYFRDSLAIAMPLTREDWNKKNCRPDTALVERSRHFHGNGSMSPARNDDVCAAAHGRSTTRLVVG